MKYYIIAGEASGDLHASNLMKELSLLDSDADFRCWGGDLMEAAGGNIVKHYRELAFMGFIEVVANLRTILKNIDLCKKDIKEWQPDVVLLVDYPGFNLRIAEFVKGLNIPVHYYISPQVWAWKASRVKKIKKTVDQMYTILPFEKPFYEKWDYKAESVGHPLLDATSNFQSKKIDIPTDKKIIAVLPGSRKQEIRAMLPLMVALAEKYKDDYKFVLAGAPSQEKSFYDEVLNGSEILLVQNDTYNLFSQAHAALVTSGTATLEAALFNIPQVVCYVASPVSYIIAKQLVKIKYISLVNLVMDQEVVTELIQKDFNMERLETEFLKIVGGEGRQSMLNNYEKLREILGGSGASKRTAQLMLKTLA